MESGRKTYYRESDPRLRSEGGDHQPEFPSELSLGDGEGDSAQFSRRGFLAALGLSTAAFTAACSRSPTGHVLPFNDKPEELTPGVALYYASVCGGCNARCGLLVKARDGRPIKLEGNDRHPLSKGALCAVGQASVLSLYDAARSRGPSIAGKPVGWKEVDSQVRAALEKAKTSAKPVFVVHPPDIGPTESAALARFAEVYTNTKRVVFDTSAVGLWAQAHESTHGSRTVPLVKLDIAKVVVGIEADFLGTWLSPVEFTKAYSKARDPKQGNMLVHYQVEPKLTLTGSNADVRFTAKPSDTVPLLAAIARALSESEPIAALKGIRAPELPPAKVGKIVGALREAKGHAVVLCGSSDPTAQVLTNLINQSIGAYTSILSIQSGTGYPAADATMEDLYAALGKGDTAGVVLWNVNPVYAHPRGAELKGLLAKVDLTVCTNDRPDETASAVKVHAPDHNALEGWADTQVKAELVSLRQPGVQPLFETRGAVESLLVWAGDTVTEEDFLRRRWESQVFPKAKNSPPTFVPFWDRALQDGFVELAPSDSAAPEWRPESVEKALTAHAANPPPQGLELWLYEKTGIRDGRLANNAWLQELPDPISKVTWGNYAVLSAAKATELGIVEGDMCTVTAHGQSVTLPALVEPGVHPSVVAVALGYGRTAAGKNAEGKGADVYPLARTKEGVFRREVEGITVAKAAGRKDLAKSQTHPSQEGRDIVRETTLAGLAKGEVGGHDAGHGKRHLSMWPDHAYTGSKWEMRIDLTACTGCSACVVACQAENNIPTVGELEVFRRREMHWMRIDRYFAGSADEPEVVHQPMLCQHCDNAPCETVCPVLATVHSSEGLNQQVYNRCVGTRYCANNCPPKVRRFNWFDYPHEDPLERMVLNPDVAVRSRGVMEKCSFCVQRIQEGKATAKAQGRPAKDGDVTPACEQSCPAGAIVFGNANDPESRTAKLREDVRNYRVLEELNVSPAVSYLTKVRAESTALGHAPAEKKHG
ncbi:MAG: 4Fe-4S dicluster domain-containing protein [Polyangiaceae bacterium]|nr:4Fe-4S dicluster domain-containing protein [Polyangiaceae bacterium]